MLTRFIVTSYAGLVELALWIAIALAVFTGYNIALPVAQWMEVAPKNAFAWQLFGASTLVVSTLLLLAVATGPLLILVDIRRSVLLIEARLKRAEELQQSDSRERREPSI
jgi:hypothetical protein